MGLKQNKEGVSAFSIMLLALLALSVVLLNGISISINKKAERKAKSGYDIAVSFCGRNHAKYPKGCKVSRVYKCAGSYILMTGCIGAGNIILNSQGNFVAWCGYSSLDGRRVDCGSYLIDEQGNDCTKSKNLCIR